MGQFITLIPTANEDEYSIFRLVQPRGKLVSGSAVHRLFEVRLYVRGIQIGMDQFASAAIEVTLWNSDYTPSRT